MAILLFLINLMLLPNLLQRLKGPVQLLLTLGGNAFIVAIASKREKELHRTFEALEQIWQQHQVYEKQENGHDL